MKKLLLILLSVATFSAEDVIVGSKPKKLNIPTVKPTPPREKPALKTSTNPILMYQDNNYYTILESNCDEYIAVIDQKDKEIEALLKEIDYLKKKELARMQKNLKEEYDKEMQKFENRGKQ